MTRAEEYNSLRQEILQNYNHIKDYRNLAYSSTIAILAFSFSEFALQEPFICLLPIMIVLPLYLLCEGCFTSISKIGSFINVFFYDDGYVWERIQHDFEKRFTFFDSKKVKKGFLWRESSFIAIIITCGLITLYKCLKLQYSTRELIVRIFIIIAIIIMSLWTVSKTNVYVMKERLEYIEKWKQIKPHELTDKLH